MILKLILIQIGTLLLIVFILRQIFSRHVNSALTNLQGLYQDNLKREEVLNEEITRTKKLRDEEIARAKEEARQILAEEKEKAEKEAERIIREAEERAQAEAKQILEKASLQLDNEYREMLQSLQDKIADFSEKAISYILSQRSRRLLQDEMTEELLRDLGNIPEEKIKLGKGINEVKITCAYPLEKSKEKRIKELISQHLSRQDLAFDFKVDEAIIGGLIINFGGKIIDGSLHNRLRQALYKIETRQDFQFRPPRPV
jgi:F0F1-type ATP synthase delta subunit